MVIRTAEDGQVIALQFHTYGTENFSADYRPNHVFKLLGC